MVSDDVMYIMAHKDDIVQQYSGQFVAISHGKVVASGKTIHEVYDILNGINEENPLVTYVPREGEEALLI